MSDILLNKFLTDLIASIECTYLYYQMLTSKQTSKEINEEYDNAKKYILNRINDLTNEQVKKIEKKQHIINSITLKNRFDN